MFGVKAWNVYVPRYRLSRDVIAAATGAGSRGGERAVANYDEDCLTMAVEAGSGCNGSAETAQIDALHQDACLFIELARYRGNDHIYPATGCF